MSTTIDPNRRAKGLIRRLATEARQSGDLVRAPEALAAMYYGA